MLRRKVLQLLLMSTAPFIMGIPTVASASGGGSGPGGSDGSSGGGSGPGGSGGGSGPGGSDGSSGGGSGPGGSDGSSGGGSGPGDNDGVAGGSGYSGGISGSRAGDVSSQNGSVNDVESALDSDGMEAVDADDVASALAEFN